jgi:hypothetical protein
MLTNASDFDLCLEIVLAADRPTAYPAQHRYLTDVR